ncbi:MAG: serine/threonine protein kinase [Planctomycetaceae bacterium]|jgi:tRNA A-37 threonylcarbamoyl transferase component Bud32|nr:serine/threonine protein kinase [Planctomycetaceae bacterium]
MTINESQIGTVVQCDRCGRVIETIAGNRIDSASPSGLHKSDQSSVYQTPANGTHEAENSQNGQAEWETEKNQPDKLDSNSSVTIVSDGSPTKIANKNKTATGRANLSDHAATLASTDSGHLPPIANTGEHKTNSRNSDEFMVDLVAKKTTVASKDNLSDRGTNKKSNWQREVPPAKNPDNVGVQNAAGTVAVSNNDETVFASSSGRNNAANTPISSGSSHKNNYHSDPGRFGSSINLDLTKRVMKTISQSGVDLSDASGANVGGYGVHRILRQHQRGGMGRIMIAYDQHLKRDVALKELHKEVIDDISIVRRFVGEAEITAQLEHPGIVPIHWLGLDKDGLPYYTMKLIRGKTYQDAIKDYHRNPSKQELKNLVRRLVSICKTIGFAHERGVIHRDLKPANIMLGEHGETLVMDWGLAKPLRQKQDEEDEYNSMITRMSGDARTELTMVGAIVGTPAFMSPEQASPEDNVVGTHSDIYSLGTILYYLLAGQTAFSGRSTREVLAKVRAASPTRPSEIKLNVPAGLEAVCMKAMAKDPKNRYQTAKEMDEDLCRWLDDIPVKAMRITSVQKFFRWVRRHWATAISIPLAAAAIIMLTSFIIKYDRSYKAKTDEETRRIALESEVDLTEQGCVMFRGGHNIDVETKDRFTGGKMIVCKLKSGSEINSGVLEILAPSDSAWDLSGRRRLKFSVFEYYSAGSMLPLDNLKIRLGRGSAYFEFQPSKSSSGWWSKRKYGNWWTYWVPLDGSPDWPRTISDNPQFETIDWIEFHFDSKPEDTFQIDDIMFLQNE